MWKKKKKKKKKKVFLMHSVQLAIQYSTGPCLKVWYRHSPALFDWCLHSEIMDQYIYIICQYIDQARVWNDVLLQGLYSSGLSPVISGNRQWTWANCPEGEGRLHVGSCIGYNSAWSIDRCWQLSNTCSLQLGHCWVFCGVRCCRLVLYTVQV